VSERPSWFVVFVGAILLVPTIVSGLAIDAFSPWGVAEWLALASLTIGLMTARWRRRRAWGPGRTGAVAIPALIVLRLIAGGVSEHARSLVLPAAHEARLVDRVFEERDAAILGARVLAWSGVMHAPEFPTLPSLLTGAYDDMNGELGHRMGTVIPSTFFGSDTGDAFAAYVVEPDGEVRGSVVFLHGFAGNFMLQCWQVAVAARAANMRTICPSTDFSGRWSDPHGERIARVALYYAHRGGLTVLAGLSNGGVGASRLAPDLGGEIGALVLLSGADPRASDPHVPTLVVHGDHDHMAATASARAYRDAHRSRVRYVELDGTHFVLLERANEVRAAITRFLLDHQTPGAREEAR
jgi:hypothetical protein